MEEHIRSLQNPLVKQGLRLQQKASERRKTGLFVAEGRREVSLALSHGFQPGRLLVCREIYEPDPHYPIHFPPQISSTVSRAVYNKLAWRSDAEGVILVGHQKNLSPKDLVLPESPFILLLEALEKPGNLGAVLRTADAAGVDAVILADAATDLYNPNAIRSSLGCVFTLPIASCSGEEAMNWLSGQGSSPVRSKPEVIAASLQASLDYYGVDMTGSIVLAFGAEDKGLSPLWQSRASRLVRIPMAGSIDSLNLSASVAILCYEAVRQRIGRQ